MSSYTISDVSFLEKDAFGFYEESKNFYGLPSPSDLDFIFKIALSKKDRFPSIKLSEEETVKNYINQWVKGYVDAINNTPSKRHANPKSSCSDPAIKVIVKETQGLSNYDANIGERHHNLFMSAENIQGNLLEEYIAFSTRQYGFLWCQGNVLRAVDFCTSDGSLLLQIKNKSNTENSSSSNIRQGTAIKKWYRLGTQSRDGKKFPKYKWEELNEIVNTHKTEGMYLTPIKMCEEDYQDFLVKISAKNSGLITDL